MPFDSSTFPAADLAPDLSRPTLRGLAWLLRHKGDRPEKFRWDFNNVLLPRSFTKFDCGTAGCALGLALLQWTDTPRHKIACPFVTQDWAQKAFGMTHEDVRDIFFNPKRPAGLFYGVLNDKVTASMVASAIDRYLADHPEAE